MTAPARPRTLAERQALWRERRDLREAAYREALERVRDGCPTRPGVAPATTRKLASLRRGMAEPMARVL